jgi:cell wall-associated NlpC family hydrolase
MASHSRVPRPRFSRIIVSRAACTLALASATSVTLFGEVGQAEPRLTPEEVKAEVDSLYQEAEQATEQYNGAKEQADAARSAVADLQDELARKTARLNTARDAVGTLAAAQYRSGSVDPALQLAFSSTPEAYLERAGLLDQLGSRQTTALRQLATQQRDIDRTRAEADAKLATLRTAQDRVADRKKTVQAKLTRAQALLARLTAQQQAAIQAADGTAASGSAGGTRSGGSTSGTTSGGGTPAAGRGTTRAPLTGEPAPSPRAAQAVAFAYRALGLPYVWGATGPGAYDCSGLTQAAWKSAGVSLPRTTYTQINAGTRVPESALRPGDLVFFYSGVSHVGIYVGNGQMIHAPHPGAPVRVAPLSEMPFAGATRPA